MNRPMMSEAEIKYIDGLLESLRPKHCLEWGSGGSTVYFPKKHKFVRWLAVEHNGNYLKKIADNLADNANVVWVSDDQWYMDCVKHSRIFDFILIDGLHREICLEIAKDIISKDGVILLHDAGRKDYQAAIKEHNGEIVIQGEIPEGDYFAHRGLAVFR